MQSKPAVLFSVNNEAERLLTLPMSIASFNQQGFTSYIAFNDEGNTHKNSRLAYLVKTTIDKVVGKENAHFFDVSYVSPVADRPSLFTDIAQLYMPTLIREYDNKEMYVVAGDVPSLILRNLSKTGFEGAINTFSLHSNYTGMSVRQWKSVMKYCGRDIYERILKDYEEHILFKRPVGTFNQKNIVQGLIHAYVYESGNEKSLLHSGSKSDIKLTPDFSDYVKYCPNADWSWVNEYKTNFNKIISENK